MTIRRNDIVRVMTGTEKGKEGKVLSVNSGSGRLLIEGVNKIWKHLRRSQQHPHGARIQKEAPIHASNVMLVCPTCDKPRRVKVKKIEGGDKARLCRKCGKEVVYEA